MHKAGAWHVVSPQKSVLAQGQQSQALHPVWNARQRDAALGTPCGLLTGRARVLVCRQGEEGWGQGETAEGEAEVPTELSSSQVPPTFAQAAPLPP